MESKSFVIETDALCLCLTGILHKLCTEVSCQLSFFTTLNPTTYLKSTDVLNASEEINGGRQDVIT